MVEKLQGEKEISDNTISGQVCCMQNIILCCLNICCRNVDIFIEREYYKTEEMDGG